MNDLFDKPHVKNHRWFKNLKADSAAKEKRIAKHAQSLDLGDSTGKPNLSDMFSSANRLGLLNNSKKLPDLIKTAILTAREAIDQFDFPISPAITYLNVKNVKTAGTTDDVLSGTIVLMCKFATVGGLKQTFDIPVQVVSGKVLPPSVVKFNGRDIVLAQSSVNAMVQRASSYELIPVRKQFSAPLTRDERESATELRNEIGYQAREGIGPISVCKRTYSKEAQVESYAVEVVDTINDEEQGGKVVQHVFALGEDKAKAKFDFFVKKYVEGKGDQYVVQILDPEGHIIQDTQGGGETGIRVNEEGEPIEAESDLTDKITPNEPMADMDDAKKYQNPPLRAKKAQGSGNFEIGDLVMVWPDDPEISYEGTVQKDRFDEVSGFNYKVRDNAGTNPTKWFNENSLKSLDNGIDSVGVEDDLDLNHWAKKDAVKTEYGPDDQEDYNFSPEGTDLFHAVEIEDVELVKHLLESSGVGIPERELFYAWTAADEGGLEEIKRVLTEFGQKLYHGHFKDSRVASMGTAVPGGYEKVKELMDKAQDEGKDTFPRSWIHVLRNYILEVVATASQDAWLTHLLNDGYVLNPYGSNNRGREKTAQIEDEWNDELVMDEPESHIYDGTKTPMEPGDSVKFQGHEGAIRGTIVEVNKAAGNAIIKAKGYEYRVALEDIQPLNSTFKKMYANSCIRLLPPEKKYAQIFNNLTKDPSIDDPWAATWDARDKDIHSGPKETKNKDVKPIVKGYGKKSVTRPFVE